MDLYLVQAPGTQGARGTQNPDDYLHNMLGALPGSAPIKNVKDLINRVHMEFFRRHRPIRKLVFAGHGSDFSFHIGESLFTADLDNRTKDYINQLIALRPVFAPDARFFLLACKVGRCQGMLRSISVALGGIPVHAYENFVYASDYLLFQSIDDKTDDNNNEVICWANGCTVIAPGEHRDSTWQPTVEELLDR